MRHFEKKCRILERTGYSMAFFRVFLPCPLFSAMRISPLLSLLFLFSALSAWGGTYVNSTPKELQDKLAAAVESAAKEFNFAIRGVARRRLQKSTRPYDKLFLELDGERVTFERNGSDRLAGVLGGEAVEWLGNQVTFRRRDIDGALVQTFTAEDGVRTNVYRFEEDGKVLHLDITVKSPKLKSPLVYTLQYRLQE